MTPDEVRRLIFLAVTDCYDDRGHPIIAQVEAAKELASLLFMALEDRGLLRVDYEHSPDFGESAS